MHTKWYHEALGFGILMLLLNGILLPWLYDEALFHGKPLQSILIAAAGGILYGISTVWIRKRLKNKKN